MSEILLTGAGVCGLNTAMLLAKDGHRVTVLERDAAVPPESAEDAWETWERRGVNQFRMPHFFLARFRIVLEQELPEVVSALERMGALRTNPILEAPEFITGGPQPGDEDFESITGRRPVVEATIARVAENTPGVTVRRGTAVAGLLTGTPTRPDVPHVVGVVTEDGEELHADLVVDATGRRSPLPRWLADCGARAPEETLDDSGFVYYGRTFKSADGVLPPAFGPPLQHYDSVSTIALAADNGAWAFAFIASGNDAQLRALRHTQTWAAAASLYPLVAHWTTSGTPLEPDIVVMAKIEDRERRFVVDGLPVATGLLPVADSWACSNPSVGRGASIGLLHALALRDLLRTGPIDDPLALSLAWDEVTQATVAPWFRETVWGDRHRLAEIGAQIAGVPYEPDDERYEVMRALMFAGGSNPDLLRAQVRNALLLNTLDETIDRVGKDRILAAGAGWREAPSHGPTRAELEKVVTS